jgi:FKBP-type peptidyl-prolyl cis-trans isomerase
MIAAAHLKLFLLVVTLLNCSMGFKHIGKSMSVQSKLNIRMSFDNQIPQFETTKDKKSLLASISKASSVSFALYSLFAGSKIAAAAEAEAAPATPSRGFQTKSGLKYFDFAEGSIGKSPRYGQLVSFLYTGYYRATPDSPLQVFDSVFSSDRKNKQVFLHKHGNGRIVRGIDEALHTMKVGGKRRVVVPRAIGYTDFGTGPVPTEPSDRRKLAKFLEFLDVDKGELVFDLELVMVADDENDQGYYEDEPVTQEEVRKMVLKSMSTEDNVERMDKMIQTTPKEKIFKKVVDVISG